MTKSQFTNIRWQNWRKLWYVWHFVSHPWFKGRKCQRSRAQLLWRTLAGVTYASQWLGMSNFPRLHPLTVYINQVPGPRKWCCDAWAASLDCQGLSLLPQVLFKFTNGAAESKSGSLNWLIPNFLVLVFAAMLIYLHLMSIQTSGTLPMTQHASQ